MVTSLEPRAGHFILMAGPRSLNGAMLELIARLGERMGVRVLDGGNRCNAFTLARLVHGQTQVLQRIMVSRAFTCYQVLSLLEGTPALPAPFVILDLLNTFYDEAVQGGERKRLLQVCIRHLHRLARYSGGVISLHPAAVPSQTAIELLRMLQAATPEVYLIQPPPPAPQPLRLF